MNSLASVREQLRSRILAWLHVGWVRPGSRLPSIRELSEQTGTDHRLIARAYRCLADEGLVEIRGRSGVFVTEAATVSGTGGEMVHWLSGVMVEAWRRHIPLPELPARIQEATRARWVACVESTEDHQVALSTELANGFGLQPVPVKLADGKRRPPALDEQLRSVDLVVTTAFHAAEVGGAAQRVGKPLVVVTVNPLLVEEVERLSRAAPLTVVVADPLYAQRAHLHLNPDAQARFNFVHADTPEARAAMARGTNVIATRAARRRLGIEDYHLFAPPFPFISEASARELAAALVRINVGLA